MKRLFSILAVVLLVLSGLTACGSSAGTTDTKQTTSKKENASTAKEESTPSDKETSDKSTDELLSGKHHIEIKVKDYGSIKAELDADAAPITVTNFVKLAQEGFYDGLTFHRIISGFMIQGGDPEGTGMGGSDETIKGEFSNNGVKNSILHVRGTLSMARSMDYDSASSQFFIMHQDASYLDGDYAAFGNVTEGIEVVDKICEEVTNGDGNGLVPAKDQPVITTIKVID